MEGVADISSEPLSSSNWEVYQDAFAPPPPRRRVKPWERAPITAHAPRLQGQKIWKKVGIKSYEDKENEDSAQEELVKAGTGSRKKPRLRGAKENIGDAQWLDPLHPSVHGDNSVGTIKEDGRVSIGCNVPEVIQRVTRKRTNADRFISPRKHLRSIPLIQQSPNLSPIKPLQPVIYKPGQRKKSIRTSAPRLNPSDIRTAEQQPVEQEAAITPIGVLATSDVTSAYPHILNGAGQSVDREVAESVSNQQKSSEASINAGTHMVNSLVGNTPPAARYERTREEELLPVDDSKAKESNLEDPVQHSGSESATHNLVKDAEILDLGLPLDKKQYAVEKRQLEVGNIAPNQASSPSSLEPPPSTPPKPEEADICGILEQEIPTLQSLDGVADAAMVVPGEISPGPKKPRRRISQRLSARRSSRIKRTSSIPSECIAAQEAVIAETFARPYHQAGTLFGNEAAALLIKVSPSPSAGLSDEIKRPQSPNTAEIPVLQTILPPMDQEREEPFKVIEPDASEVDASVLQSIESPCEGQLEPLEAEEPGEIGVELAAQSPEEVTTHGEPEPIIFRSRSNHNSIDELFLKMGTDSTLYDELDSSSDSTAPDAQLCDHSGSTFLPGVVASVEHSDNEATARILESSEPNSALLFITESPVGTANEGETNVTGTITSETTNGLAETTTQNTPFPSYDHDDTDMLRNFLTRVKANKAANAGQTTQKRKRSLPHSPLRLPLGDPDGTNDSPSSPRAEDELDVSLSTSSPSKRLKHNTPTSSAGDITQPKSVRRSGRTRLPVKAPLAAPSFIPVRRIGQEGDNTITLKRNEEKELAALTRVNTRKNKGGALFPADVLTKKAEEKDDPVSRQRALKEVFDDRLQKQKRGKSRKSVVWAEELAQYQIIDGKNVKVKKGVDKNKGRRKAALDEEQTPAPRVRIRSKIAIGMAANGTPAPTRKMRRRS
ncbi:uncharacterized protein BP5553_00776 [Venustampulla echinocandica]|uniref:Uncharacterized protein n=1 Tax=Venustampulla echinocandica TaxID=2656787 RepID=A0A370TZ49_9HELO|nr:uncharacterized protein BP5553_00776 [Venustampulla echinocandica]RDL40797.1 hypothetical protein BP5553_00776 [Venustampulla echinocandica]